MKTIADDLERQAFEKWVRNSNYQICLDAYPSGAYVEDDAKFGLAVWRACSRSQIDTAAIIKQFFDNLVLEELETGIKSENFVLSDDYIQGHNDVVEYLQDNIKRMTLEPNKGV